MSFKREGNDKGLLDNLRRRRINELFAEDVPENEAKLLCNGRFACLVCNHNPVFDTVNMLIVHRQGKKHAASEQEFLRKKKELQALILKRKHEQYMKDGTTTIKQAAASSSGGICSIPPYDPRVKKHKVKPYERKTCIDLYHSEPAFSQSQSPLPSSVVSNAYTSPAAVPKRHTPQLKNIFRPLQRDKEPVKPYIRQNRTLTNSSTSHHPVHYDQLPASVPVSSQSLSWTDVVADSQYSESLSSKTSSSFLHSSSAKTSAAASRLNSSSSYSVGRFPSPKAVGAQCSTETLHASADGQQLSGNNHSVDGSVRVDEEAEGGGQPVFHHAKAVGNPGFGVAGSSNHDDTTEKKILAQKYRHLSGSGWKKDWDGKWIRDEEAEFDSDEEPPNLP